MADPGSLQNLHDIVVPDPTPFWPPAPGWYAMGMVALVLACWIGCKWCLRWQNNRYRREALEELSRVAAGSLKSTSRIKALQNLNPLLKRTALAVWPRTEVADLTGDGWLAFLNRTGDTAFFGHEPARLLSEVSFVNEDKLSNLSDSQVAGLISAARLWIKHHRVVGVERPQAKVEEIKSRKLEASKR